MRRLCIQTTWAALPRLACSHPCSPCTPPVICATPRHGWGRTDSQARTRGDRSSPPASPYVDAQHGKGRRGTLTFTGLTGAAPRLRLSGRVGQSVLGHLCRGDEAGCAEPTTWRLASLRGKARGGEAGDEGLSYLARGAAAGRPQTLTRGLALRGYTIDAAYAAFQEEWVGSLAVGKRADMVIVDRDVLAVPHAVDIAQTRVLATLLDGRCTYCARELCDELCPAHEQHDPSGSGSPANGRVRDEL
jgi:hypothetical protein